MARTVQSGGAGTVGRAQSQGERVASKPQFEWLARAGLLARGVVYGIVAVLAIKLALGDGGKATDQQGALGTISRQPFGKVLLILMAIGLAGYAIWKLIRAAIGHGPESSDDTKDRIAAGVSGLVYAGLCFTAIKILAGSGGGGGSTDKQTAGVLGWPAGAWIVGIAGLIVIGVGVDQARKGVTRKFLEDSKTEQMSEGTEKLFTAVGMAGYLARAVVFAMIGFFLIKSAVEYDPDESVGLDGALAKIADGSGGPVLLGIMALGLLAFAVYSAADARFRKV